jgi:predicted transcriptional regulator/RNase P subunit RPR2
MWTTTIATLLGIFGTIALALSNHYASTRPDLEYKYLVLGIVLLSLSACIAIFKFVRWLFGLRFMRRPKKLPSDFIKKFTVRLDKETREPHCPVCLAELAPDLNPTSGIHDGSYFKCTLCNHPYRLTNEETGEPITIREAKALLSQTELQPPSSKALESEKLLEKQKLIKQPSEDYEPDEKDKRIIRYLYKEIDCYLPNIARFVELDTQETKLCLNTLAKHGFVRPPSKRPTALYDPYRLTDKGIKFAIENNLLGEVQKPKEEESIIDRIFNLEPPQSQTTKPQPSKAPEVEASSLFESDETALRILAFLAGPQHQSIYTVEIGNSLGLKHSLVDSYLRKLAKEECVRVHHDTLTNSDVCSITQKGKDFLNKPVNAIPQPSSEPDEAETEILKLLAHPYCDGTKAYLSQFLGLHPTVVQVHLTELKKRDYISANTFNEYNEPIFELTHKANKFLVDKKHIQ